MAHRVNGATSELRLRIACKMLGLSISSAGMVQEALLPQLAATVGTYWCQARTHKGLRTLVLAARSGAKVWNSCETHMLPSVRVRRDRSEQGWRALGACGDEFDRGAREVIPHLRPEVVARHAQCADLACNGWAHRRRCLLSTHRSTCPLTKPKIDGALATR